MKRIGIATALVFGLVAASASAVVIDPFNLPYSGPAQNGQAEVGFKIVHTDQGPEVRKFQFDSIVANCDKGKIALADQVDNTAELHAGFFHFLADPGTNNPQGRVAIHGERISGGAWKGTLGINGKWKGAGHCTTAKEGIEWGPASKD